MVSHTTTSATSSGRPARPIGTVGPIGGIQLKMIAARDKGATVFLAPAGNCSAVRDDTPSGLQVIKVDTLHHAVQYLKDLPAGRPVPGAPPRSFVPGSC